MSDPNMKRSTGMHCPVCCAKAGDSHGEGCPEGAIAADLVVRDAISKAIALVIAASADGIDWNALPNIDRLANAALRTVHLHLSYRSLAMVADGMQRDQAGPALNQCLLQAQNAAIDLAQQNQVLRRAAEKAGGLIVGYVRQSSLDRLGALTSSTATIYSHKQADDYVPLARPTAADAAGLCATCGDKGEKIDACTMKSRCEVVRQPAVMAGDLSNDAEFKRLLDIYADDEQARMRTLNQIIQHIEDRPPAMGAGSLPDEATIQRLAELHFYCEVAPTMDIRLRRFALAVIAHDRQRPTASGAARLPVIPQPRPERGTKGVA